MITMVAIDFISGASSKKTTTTPVVTTPVVTTPVVTPPVVTPADTTPPTVLAYSPAVGSTSAAVGSDIILTFSEPVQKGTGVIELHSGSATGSLVISYDVATSPNITVSGSNLIINPTTDLTSGTHYFVTVASGVIKDLAGNNYAGTTAYDFTATSASAVHDTTSPAVSAYSPAIGSRNATVGGDIILTFSEPVQKGTGVIELHSGSATGTLVASYDVATSSNLTVAGSNLIINPTTDLSEGTHYFVTFSAGSIKDLAGNSFAGTTTYDFSTSAAPINTTADTTPPTIIALGPNDGATGVSVSTDIVVTFNEVIQKGTGTIAIHTDSSTGTVVASTDNLTASISISGTTLTIHPTSNLDHNTHYFVTFGQNSIDDMSGNHFNSAMAYDFITVPVANTGSVNGLSDAGPALVGGGALGVLAWLLL